MSEDDLAVLGLSLDDFGEQDGNVEVWADNLPAQRIFCKVGTQWRVASGGPIGLDYSVVYRELDRLELSPEEYDALMDDIRVMEIEALSTMKDSKPT